MKLKPSLLDIEILKGRLLEEQQRRERAEAQLLKLKGVEGRAHKLELQLAACTALPG
jgi:mitotic spindle assembly checkpoint protein MAD1